MYAIICDGCTKKHEGVRHNVDKKVREVRVIVESNSFRREATGHACEKPPESFNCYEEAVKKLAIAALTAEPTRLR